MEVERHWTEKKARQSDLFLMDVIIQYNFTPKQLQHINHCRLYLQVILLSDITSADGKHVLHTVQSGFRPKDRSSNLHWPRQEKPPEVAWDLWRTALDHISPAENYNNHWVRGLPLHTKSGSGL